MKLKEPKLSPKNRFDMEQEILAAWGTCEDIQLIYEKFYDNHESMSVDDMANLLLGLKEMHQIRCEKLFNTFEEMIRDGQICKPAI